MAKCAYCDSQVAMPFKCKLCLLQYCERHRLPENHECPNLFAYDTDDYRKFKSTMRDEYVHSDVAPNRKISWKSGDQFSGTTRGALFGGNTDFWSSGDKRYDMVYLALIVAFRTVLFSLNGFSIAIDTAVLLLVSSLILGVFGFMSLLYVRERIAISNGISNQFYFSKLFVLITLLLSLISGVFNSNFFAIFIPGFFVMLSAENIKNTYNVATQSAFAVLGFWFIFSVVLPSIFIATIPELSYIILSSRMVGMAILHLGIYTLFTEYKAISYWNRNMLIVIVVLYVIAFFL